MDKNQPLYAEGGWFVSKQNASRASEEVERLEKLAGFGDEEKKGSELICKPEGQAFIADVCKALGQAGCIPFVYVVEKRYFACSKLVETFFDPEYNPAIATSDTWNPEKRQADAELFYSFSDALIDEFAEAYRAKDPSLVKSNAEKWVVAFTEAERHGDAARLKSVLGGIEDAIRSEKNSLRSGSFPSGLNSLSVPIVSEVFQFIENHCPYKCDIIHDQTSSFEPIYSHIFNLHKQASHAVLTMMDGRKMVVGFRNCCSLAYADSKFEPLVRASDYLLSGVSRFIRLAREEHRISAGISRVAFSGLGGILCEAMTHMHPGLGSFPHLGSVMASGGWAGQVFQRLIAETKTMEQAA